MPPRAFAGAGIERHEKVRIAADEVTLPFEMDARTLRPAHAALRGSAAEQKSRRSSARRRVAGLALGAATSTTSVLVIAGNPSLLLSTRCSGRIATSGRMLTPMPTETAAWMPTRLGLV